MCGLNFLRPKGPASRLPDSQKERLVRQMLLASRHRGTVYSYGVTDQGGFWSHARLPILGTGREFTAPLSHDGNDLLYVGEALNFREFYPEAKNDGQAYLEALTDKTLRLDERNLITSCVGFGHQILTTKWGGTLVITDPMNYKPLYFRPDMGAFSSEIKPLVAIGKTTWDDTYFGNVIRFGYEPGNRTPFQEITTLAPNRVWDVSSEGIRSSPSIPYIRNRGEQAGPGPVSEGEFLRTFHEMVRLNLVSDVPIGVLCSGGLDSTAVLLAAIEIIQEYPGDRQLTVFHTENEESDYFDMVPIPWWVKKVKLTLPQIPEPEVMFFNEGPVDLGSMMPQYQLAREIEKYGIRVVLSGDGADELFGGYRRSMLYDSQSADYHTELLHYHLPRLDKLMMAETIELRAPFLTGPIIEQAFSLPWELRRDKNFLRTAFRHLVPTAICTRKKHPLKSPHIRQSEASDSPQEARAARCKLFKETFHKRLLEYT